MNDIEPLIEYLKIHRRYQEAKNIDQYVEIQIVDQHYDSQNIDSNIQEVPRFRVQNLESAWNLTTILTVSETTSVYILVIDNSDTENSIQYYERKLFLEGTEEIYKYKKFGQTNWNTHEDKSFIEVPLIHQFESYYYDYTIKRVIISNSLDNVFIVEDFFSYNSEDIGVKNNTYSLDYVDHDGYDNSFFDRNLKFIFNPILKKILDPYHRRITVRIAPGKGKVYLFPFIRQKNTKIFLEYKYKLKKFSRFDIKEAPSAIILEFNYFGTFLSFINQIVFYGNHFDSLEGNNNLSVGEFLKLIIQKTDTSLLQKVNEGGMQQFFVDEYVRVVTKEFSFYQNRLQKSLELLFYTPRIFKKHLRSETLWNIVGRALEEDLTNNGLNREDIVITLLNVIHEKSDNSTAFLHDLLHKKTNDNSSYFYKLFNKMNTTNFVKYNTFLKDIWKESLYRFKGNPLYTQKHIVDGESVPVYDGLSTIPYKSDKTMGFYHSNVDIKWISNYSELKLFLVTDKSKIIKNYKNQPILVPEILDYTYHPFQPITILNVEDQKAELGLEGKIPAFYLKAVEAKKTVANIYTTLEYSLDAVTTVSGVGNIAKFRHLAKLAKVASRLSKAQKAAKYATVVSKIKLFAGAVELTSGTINTLIKLTGIKETQLGQEISEILFWLEMASLSGEFVGAIKAGFRNRAKSILRQQKKLKKEYERLQQSKRQDGNSIYELEDTLLTLYEAAGIIKKEMVNFIKKWRGKNLKKLSLNEIVSSIKGYTKFGDEIAELLKSRKIKINVLDKKTFKKKYIENGGDPKTFEGTKGFNIGNKSFYLDDLTPQEFLSTIIHEASHSTDYLKARVAGKKLSTVAGDNHAQEIRAYTREFEFQEAVGIGKDFDTREDIIKFVKGNYEIR